MIDAPVVRPAVFVFHHPEAAANLVAAFKLGCEEEGVPVETRMLDGHADQLARSAAESSSLFVGAGIDNRGTIAIHEQRLGERPAFLCISMASTVEARPLGTAAGRLVRGRPIDSIVADDNSPER